MHLLGEFDRLPVGYNFSGGAQMNYVGIDHHRQYSHVTLMDQEGQVLRSGRDLTLECVRTWPSG